MGRLITRRVLSAVPLLLLVSLLTFSLVNLLPGDPAVAIAGDEATRERVEEIRARLHLDDPFLQRYTRWLGAALHGDLGYSDNTGVELTSEILRRLPITASLAGGAILFAIIVGIPIGLLQGTFPRSRLDRVLQLVTSLGLAVPSFWLATILVTFFAVKIPWFPSFGYTHFSESPFEWARGLVLPVLALGLFPAAELARQLRAGLLVVRDEDYIRTAWAKGLTKDRVVMKHALKNAAMPALTILGVRAGRLLAGSVIIEAIFSMPGLGKMTIDAVFSRDFSAIQAVVLVAAVIVVTMNLVVDVLYSVLNPKVRMA